MGSALMIIGQVVLFGLAIFAVCFFIYCILVPLSTPDEWTAKVVKEYSDTITLAQSAKNEYLTNLQLMEYMQKSEMEKQKLSWAKYKSNLMNQSAEEKEAALRPNTLKPHEDPWAVYETERIM